VRVSRILPSVLYSGLCLPSYSRWILWLYPICCFPKGRIHSQPCAMPRYCRLPKFRSIVVGVTPSVDNALPGAPGLERPMNQRSVVYLIVLSQIPRSDAYGVISVAQSIILHMRAESSGLFSAYLVPVLPTHSKGMSGLVRQQSYYTMRVYSMNSTLTV
jgi:hypothetical protein